jgi:hypothetical protein
MLNALHARCVMHPPFPAFHLVSPWRQFAYGAPLLGIVHGCMQRKPGKKFQLGVDTPKRWECEYSRITNPAAI